MHAALDTIWASLPIPAILVDAGDKIAEINPAPKGFSIPQTVPSTAFPCLIV